MMKKLMLMLVVLVFAGSAFAMPTEPYRLAFITPAADSDAVHWGEWDLSTSLDDADAFMQGLADAAGIGIGGMITDPTTGDPIDVTWKVLGSASYVDARDHTGTNPYTDGDGVPIYLYDGVTLVALNNADLWDGSPTHIINQDQNGNTTGGWPMTGSKADGTVATTQNGRGLDQQAPLEIQQGNGGSTTQMFWRSWTSRPADESNTRWQACPLYALSDIIPEPATMCLLGLGGLLLRRKR